VTDAKKLDRSKPFSTISGAVTAVAGISFGQGNAYFSQTGEFVQLRSDPIGSPTPPEPTPVEPIPKASKKKVSKKKMAAKKDEGIA